MAKASTHSTGQPPTELPNAVREFREMALAQGFDVALDLPGGKEGPFFMIVRRGATPVAAIEWSKKVGFAMDFSESSLGETAPELTVLNARSAVRRLATAHRVPSPGPPQKTTRSLLPSVPIDASKTALVRRDLRVIARLKPILWISHTQNTAQWYLDGRVSENVVLSFYNWYNCVLDRPDLVLFSEGMHAAQEALLQAIAQLIKLEDSNILDRLPPGRAEGWLGPAVRWKLEHNAWYPRYDADFGKQRRQINKVTDALLDAWKRYVWTVELFECEHELTSTSGDTQDSHPSQDR